MESDSDYLRTVALGYRLSQALNVFAELRVADLLADGPLALAALAHQTQAHEQSLQRLLRIAAGMGLVTQLPDDHFELTERGRLLRRDVEGSMWPRVRSVGSPWQWNPWGKLLDAVVSGKSAFEAEYGLNSFDYFNQTPGAGSTMMDRVTVEAKQRGGEIADAFDFAAVSCVIDVGGGRGAILGELLSHHPDLRGVLIDLPYAVDGAAELLRDMGVADRCEVVAGDFRTNLPDGGDVCLLSAIVHSWNDDDSVELLKRCFEKADRVIIVDEAIEPANASVPALLKDLQLMVFSGGRHRSLAEYGVLFERAGAKLVRHERIGKQELLMEGRVER